MSETEVAQFTRAYDGWLAGLPSADENLDAARRALSTAASAISICQGGPEMVGRSP